jgi:hypothetical protein
MADELDRTLAALGLDDEFAAAAALARLYAGQLDSAAAVERQAGRVLREAIRAGVDPELREELEALRRQVAARATIANLGPRFESLLGRLLATPKDAGSGKPAAPAEPPTAAKTGALANLRKVHG